MRLYIYHWGNTKDAVGKWRMRFKGRTCRILARNQAFNTVLIEFLDDGKMLNTSLNAIRLVKNET